MNNTTPNSCGRLHGTRFARVTADKVLYKIKPGSILQENDFFVNHIHCVYMYYGTESPVFCSVKIGCGSRSVVPKHRQKIVTNMNDRCSLPCLQSHWPKFRQWMSWFGTGSSTKHYGTAQSFHYNLRSLCLMRSWTFQGFDGNRTLHVLVKQAYLSLRQIRANCLV